jgi:hypothetical protein
MYFIIFTQLLELKVPKIRVRLVLDIELKTNFLELHFSFLIHYAMFEA